MPARIKTVRRHRPVDSSALSTDEPNIPPPPPPPARTTVPANSKAEAEEAIESREEREALIGVVYHSNPTALDVRRAIQRKRRRDQLQEELTGKRSKTASALAAPPRPVLCDDVLRPLFLQEILMSALTSDR